jgi:hypothetical protein
MSTFKKFNLSMMIPKPRVHELMLQEGEFFFYSSQTGHMHIAYKKGGRPVNALLVNPLGGDWYEFTRTRNLTAGSCFNLNPLLQKQLERQSKSGRCVHVNFHCKNNLGAMSFTNSGMRAIRAFVDTDSGFTKYGPAYIGQFGPCGIRGQSNKMPEGKYVLYRCHTGDMRILFRRHGQRSEHYSFNYRINVENGLIPLHAWESLRFKPLISQAAREAIHEWTLCARELGLIRDVRIYIGKIIWELRHLFMP